MSWEKIVSSEKSPDRELARFQGVVVGKDSGSSMVMVEISFTDHTETAAFSVDMFDGKLSLYGQPVDLVVRVNYPSLKGGACH